VLTYHAPDCIAVFRQKEVVLDGLERSVGMRVRARTLV
jgi:hypothetical protein